MPDDNVVDREIFDARRAIKLREEALRKVEQNAKARWRADALRAVEETARHHRTFIVDAPWKRLARITDYKPHEGRAMGAVMRRAASAGYIESTPDFRPSARIKSHRTPRRIWRSLIYRQPPPEPEQQPLSFGPAPELTREGVDAYLAATRGD
jgi:hypothetical protein